MGLSHGLSRTYPRERNIWSCMKERCRNPNLRIYKHYGGRGIEFCERWQDFANFIADMGPSPKGMELDRINNDGNYEPDNCRWVTRSQNCRNYSRNVVLTFNGVTKTMIEWAEEKGISYGMLKQRIGRHGWSTEEALTTPPMRNQFV